MTERLVVIGGDAAGMSAASQARRRRPPEDLEIVVLERSGWISFSACGEPYFIAGEVTELESLLARRPERFEADGITVRMHTEATSIDAERRVVGARGPDGELELAYDNLVYATGAAPLIPDIRDADAAGAFTLRTLDDAAAIEAAAGTATRAVVVGGGYIGIEVAEALHRRGIPTTIVTSGDTVMNRVLDEDMGNLATDAIRDQGVEVRPGIRVRCLVDGGGAVIGVDADDDILPADLVVIGVGATPEVELAESAGVALGPTGAIAVDERQRTSVDGIWAAGDCAEARHLVSGLPVNHQLGTVANKQGRVAGINLGGGDATFPGVLGTAITRFGQTEISRTGLSERDASEAGIAYAVGMVESSTIAGYMPGAASMTIKALCELGTGRILGGQIVGGHGAGKRIDTFAVAIWGGLGGHDLAMADLSYAPPFSGVWEPVMIAARRAADRALGITT
ncbi:MAG: FAD-dependent oxidoreductase [Acidimicrobiia bacterium]|nr:FAD-dependent oxidoreductase [Acidimicrobiia bacterium]